MNTVSKELELPGAFLLGAAGAPSRILGMNAEVNHLNPPITPQVLTKILSCRAAYLLLSPILSPDISVKGLRALKTLIC